MQRTPGWLVSALLVVGCLLAADSSADVTVIRGEGRTLMPGLVDAHGHLAMADPLLVDGDPITDIQLIADPGRNFVVIMKDGGICRNSVH